MSAHSIMTNHIFLLALMMVFITCSRTCAYDPGLLQDFCVADLNSSVRVNGFVCKDPKTVHANDFFFSGLDKAGNTSKSSLGSSVNLVNVLLLPGVNTLGISQARLDFAPGGTNPPHTHPRASEFFTVLEGTLYVGFVTSDPEYRLISKVLQKGDAFVFPQGLTHFQYNVGNGNVIALATFNSQNPGIDHVDKVAFGSNPAIPDDVLVKSFQVGKNVIDLLKAGSARTS